jgi:hypothetical protein
VALKTLVSPHTSALKLELCATFAEPKHVSGRDSEKAIFRFTHQNTSENFPVKVMEKDDPGLRCLLTPETLRKMQGRLDQEPTAKTYRLTFTYHAKSIRDRLGLAILNDRTYGPFTDTVHRVCDVLMSTSPVTVHFITLGKTNMESRMAEMQTSFKAQRNKHPLQQ